MENLKLKKSTGGQKFQVIKYVGKNENMMFWEKSFLEAAQWFAEIPEFSDLDMDVRIDILKSTWMIWARLDKLAQSAEFQKKQLLRKDLYMWTEDSCMDLKDIVVDISWCTNYSKEQLRGYLVQDLNKYWKQSLADIIELEPTPTELNFMLIQLCLHEAGKRHQGRILEITDQLLQIQADNLHDYYIRKMNMPHYSGRLAKLMKINKRIEAEVRERKEYNYLSGVFNLYSVEYSHPEMFIAA